MSCAAGLLVLGAVSSARADTVPDRGGSFAIARWTIADGLPQSSITGVVQARDGYLWLTTFGGVVRFDGVRFEVYDLATHPSLGGHRFVGVQEDPRGDLYLGIQDHGLTRLRAGRFEPVMVPGSPRGGVNGPVAAVDGTLWATIGFTLVRIRDGLATAEALPRELLEEVPWPQLDTSGALWLVNKHGVVCWSGACAAPRVRQQPTAAWLDAVSSGRHGARWDLRWGDVPGCPQPPGARGLVRVFSWRGRRWCGAGHELVGASEGEPPTRIDLSARAAYETHDIIGLYSVLADREGALWVGTSGGGLFQIQPRNLRRFGAGEGLTGTSVWSLVGDFAGRVWAASAEGLALIDHDRVEAPPPALAALGEVDALAVDGQDHLWLAASGRGLFRYDGAQLEAVSVAAVGTRRVTTLATSARGGLWILGPELGALRWSDGRVVESLSVDALGGEPQVLREAVDGTLWVGTTGGLARVRADGTRLYTAADGLAPGTIRDVMLRPEGTVWVGSYGGGLAALRVDGRIVRITRDHGLCDNVASRLIDDGLGTVWINGNRGVYRVRYEDLESVASGRSASLQCGLLASGEGNGNGGFRADDGRLWFPTISGVVVIDRREVGEPVAPIGHIASMSLAGVPVEEGQEVPPMRGDLVVEVTALSFGDPRGLHFRHRLIGYDAAPVDAGMTRVVRYTRLPPGRYRFEFQARSVDGVWSAPVARSFELQPHFYQRWRFYLLLSFALVLLVWGVITLRTHSMARHNRALEREIAERAKITEALRLQELHYRTLFEGTSDGIFVHEPSGRLVELNPAGSTMVRRTRAELLASEPLSHVEPESREAYRGLIERALAGEQVAPLELRLVAAGGAAVEARLGAVLIDQTSRPHVLISAVDLTAERRAERERQALELQLRQSQKLEALGKLAGGIAHDFNNLLTAIGVQASLLQGADQDEVEAIEGISVAVKRAAALTKKLLVFGRQDLHSPVVVTVAAQLEEVMTVLRRTLPADVRLVLESQAPGVRVKVDPVRLEQMIINLVVNARDAIHGAGTIRIDTACLVLGESEAVQRGCAPGEYVSISVSDDGSGIEAGVMERIFEPFFTTKDVGKGSGLGLSIVHGAVREAGGFVTVESEVGCGSTFVLHLPLVDDVVAESASAVVAARSGDGLTVLLCDDEPVVRKASAKALRSVGYRVLDADGPDEALDLARQHVRELRVLVTDVVMPVMSGPELARRVRAVVGELPVLFISGHTRDVVIDRGVGGEAEFLAKPFTVDVLVGRVGALIARATPAGGVEVVRREDLN